jgi:hypothetical protein
LSFDREEGVFNYPLGSNFDTEVIRVLHRLSLEWGAITYRGERRGLTFIPGVQNSTLGIELVLKNVTIT